MGSLLNGLGGLFKATAKEPDEDVPQARSAMDMAMQSAIENRAAAGAGDDATHQPRVTITSDKSRSVFGRRGA